MNVRRKVDKRILDTSWHTSSLSYYRNDYYKGQQNSIGERYFFVVVVRCTSAILYNLIAMWHLVLAFMLKSYVCIVALNSPSLFIRRCDGGGGGVIITLSNAPGPSIYYFVFVVVLCLFIHLFFCLLLIQSVKITRTWHDSDNKDWATIISSFMHLVFLVKYPFQGGSVKGCKFWCLRLGAYHWP